MKFISCILLCALSFVSFSQNKGIEVFENLVGSEWISEGLQLGGFEGKTVHDIEWGLNGKIVKVKTYTTDPKTKEFSLRNEGIRTFNSQTDQLEFYEFDKLGGVTSGSITADGSNIYFEYVYEGLTLRDSWIYQTKDEYQLIVGIWKDGKWTKKFHEATFIRK